MTTGGQRDWRMMIGASTGGSRGARAYLDANGEEIPARRDGPVSWLRFRREREHLRRLKLMVSFDGRVMRVTEEPLRSIEDPSRIFSDRYWADHLTDAIADDGYRHR